MDPTPGLPAGRGPDSFGGPEKNRGANPPQPSHRIVSEALGGVRVGERSPTQELISTDGPYPPRAVGAAIGASVEALRQAAEKRSVLRCWWHLVKLRSTLRADPVAGANLLNLLSSNGAPLLCSVATHLPQKWLVHGLLRAGLHPGHANIDGDAALHILARTPKAQDLALAALLVNYGAPLDQPNQQGECPLSILAMRGEHLLADRWANLTPETERLSVANIRDLVRTATAQLSDATQYRDGTISPDSLLESLQAWRRLIGPEAVRDIINTPGPTGLNIFHAALLTPVFQRILRPLVSLGADPNRPTEAETKMRNHSSIVEEAASESRPLHLAVLLKDDNLAAHLIELGANPRATDSNGNLPLHLATSAFALRNSLARDFSLWSRIISTLPLTPDSLAAKNAEGITPLANLSLLPSERRKLLPSAVVDKVDVALRSLMPELAEGGPRICWDKLTALPQALRDEANRLFERGKNLQHVLWYVMAANGDEATAAERGFSTGLARLLPHLLNFYPSGSANELIHHLATHHAKHMYWDSECMALLNHPRRDPSLEDGSTEAIVKAFQDVSGGTLRSENFSWRELRNWARIGTLCHSFTRWKYESMRAVPTPNSGAPITLLEAYGFQRMPERSNDRNQGAIKGFGPGFVLPAGAKSFKYFLPHADGREIAHTHSPDTHIEFRRAYLLISNPRFGTLIIRNSSPVFGRDTLPHAAYYSSHRTYSDSKQQSRRDQLTYSEITSHFEPVISSAVAGTRTREVEALLDELTGVMQDFAAWKFDTRFKTAWYDPDDSGKKELAGGHYSSGFPEVMRCIKELRAGGARTGIDATPELAFIDPDQSTWATYAFHPLSGGAQTRLKLDDRAIDVLSRLSASEPVTDQELFETGVRAFLQEAGLKKQGELVLLTPEISSPPASAARPLAA